MSKFQQRHYQAVAQVIQQIETDGDDKDGLRREVIAKEFADMFKADNANFKRDLFMYASKKGNNVLSRRAH